MLKPLNPEKVRARVLKVEGTTVALGVYHQGEWLRIAAQTRVPLEPFSWIEGYLLVEEETGMLQFRIQEMSGQQTPESFSGGLDLEA